MWITTVFGYICIFSLCFAQELTSLNAQAVTETPRVNQTIDWGTTLPPVTLRIRDGRTNAQNRPQNEMPELPLVYSNQWKPFIMPMRFNSFIDQNIREESEESIYRQFVPTFLRRPDSNLNWTAELYPSAQPYDGNSEPSQAVSYLPSNADKKYHVPIGNQFAPSPIPMRPFFYPYPVNIDVRENNQQNYKDIQNSSESVRRPLFYESDTASMEDQGSRMLSTNNEPVLPLVSDRFAPRNYASPRGFLPSVAPIYFPPYPIFPPVRNVNVPDFDRETGTEVVESAPPEYDLPEFEQSIPSNVPNSERNPPVAPPYGAIPSFVPLVPSRGMPVPVRGFPFGLLPPPILPPLLQNPTASRFLPTSSLQPESLNLPEENPAVEVITPPLPTEDRLPVEPIAVLHPGDTLPLDTEQSPNLEGVKQNLFQNEKPNIAKIPYEFGYDMNDGKGTDQHRLEVSDASGVVTGSYGYRDPFGVYRLVNYIADKNGFRAFINSNEPGVASSGSADVVVVADHPPPHAVAEAEKVPEPEAIIVSDETTDLIAEGSA